MQSATLKLKGGIQIELRRPTEKQVLQHLDKRQMRAAGHQAAADITDDGDEEILACVAAPARAEMLELLDECPRLADQLGAVFLALASGDLPIRRDDSALTSEVCQRLKVRPRRALAVRLGDQVVICSKFTRFEEKTLELDAARREDKLLLRSALAAAAKLHVLEPADSTALFTEVPALAAQLGVMLWRAAAAELEAEQGESVAATSSPAATPSASGSSSS